MSLGSALNKYTVEQLKGMLDAKNLSTEGEKRFLVARLWLYINERKALLHKR